ncbi:LicD family protein [Fusobacterium ulcerans]|uniref:LicD family protein n=1 Tax=Fusobacterium ulcerans TaxID=861 RepID=UPI0039B5E37C
MVYSYGYYLTWRKVFNPEDIFPLKKSKFENFLFYIPNNPQNILTTLYKDFIKLPPENKRYTHAKLIKRKEKIE